MAEAIFSRHLDSSLPPQRTPFLDEIDRLAVFPYLLPANNLRQLAGLLPNIIKKSAGTIVAPDDFNPHQATIAFNSIDKNNAALKLEARAANSIITASFCLENIDGKRTVAVKNIALENFGIVSPVAKYVLKSLPRIITDAMNMSLEHTKITGMEVGPDGLLFWGEHKV